MFLRYFTKSAFFASAAIILALYLVPVSAMSAEFAFYEHINYRGHNVTLGPDNYRRIRDIGLADDTLSSLWIISQMPSGTVILYEHSEFRGNRLTVTQATPNLGESWNDRVSSFRILDGYWTFYKDDNYNGRNVTLGPGNYRWVKDVGFPNDALSSLRPR